MPKRILLDIGSKFHRIIVTENLPTENGLAMVGGICDCGKIVKVSAKSLKSSNTKSCGCLKEELLAERNIKHGLAGTRFYRSWQHMKERCNDPNSQYYKDYGGRGIKYDTHWEVFENFMEDMYLATRTLWN